MASVKFIFILKNGKAFECLEELSAEQFLEAVNTLKISMREGVNGMLQVEDCCVRLSEVAVAEWEVLDESKAEKS